MRKKGIKTYEKALSLYNDGYIDKAILVCEVGISRDLQDSNLLNLKGLLLYLKGDLEDAISLWKINKYNNEDEISEAYLKDIERDFQRRDLFKDAEKLIEDLNIDAAIEVLMYCKESDYNSINVNNALAICYMRKGQYDDCKRCIEKVFSLDKGNILANSINKEIDEILNTNSNRNIGIKPILVTSIICIIIVSGILVKYKLQNNSKNNTESSFDIANKNESIVEENSGGILNSIDNSTEEISNETEEVSNVMEEINDGIEDKEEVDLEHNALTEEEIRENYIESTNLFAEENYDAARDILEDTVLYSENNHLNDDIIFLLASTYERLGMNDQAIKSFEKYISSYENGNYIEESYYKISLLYKDLNTDKSKYYAKELASKYSNSIYNNSNIDDILNN
ncbi:MULTISPECIES: tetratricopeptide repeat protein [unclassified Clostridium]|uniref:tetratricopeptide repeat protein n=1 Tax=unclassified Clostridium TaxID=2614128 RepID=UPI001896C4D5|nr:MULTISPECIES: tetratricopeptide repeat protein [unclassified Clostridium]MCR1952138.1 tetratricopeptide repeat protein [Clostridium sp. DSM 100503]